VESGRWLTEKVTGAFPSSRSTTNNLKGVATPMTDLKFALMELMRKYQPDQDMLREGLQLLAEALMELEVTQKVGAGRYERTSERTNYRNGYRLRNWDTRVGTIALRIPRLRQGAYLPCLAACFAAQWCRPGCPSSGGGTRYGSWCARRYVHSVRRRPSA